MSVLYVASVLAFMVQSLSGVEKKRMNFQRSFQPMLIWMRCVGIYLEPPLESNVLVSSSLSRYIVIPFGLAIFCLNLYLNGIRLAEHVLYFTSHQNVRIYRKVSSATIWNATISVVNIFVVQVLPQMCFISAAANKWPNVVRVLRNMEKENQFQQKDYEKFRPIFLVGLVLHVVGFLFLYLMLVLPLWMGEELPVVDKINYSAVTLLSIYLFTGNVFFTCLCWMASDMLTCLALRVEQAGRYGNQVNVSIDTWRHQNYRVFQLVDKINHFHGPYLLVFISSCFVMTVNSSFNVMMSANEANNRRLFLINFLLLIIQFSLFTPLVYAPHRLRQSAIRFSKQLRALQPKTTAHQNKINFFVIEILHSLPTITVLGLFEVGLHLIPKFIGTTLTYLIILCQFQYSETNDTFSEGPITKPFGAGVL